VPVDVFSPRMGASPPITGPRLPLNGGAECETAGVVIVLALVFLVVVAIPALCIWAAIDAASQPEWAFEAAGTSKTLWIVLPIVGMFVCFVGAIAAVLWFGTYKPKVLEATRRGPSFGSRSV